MSFSSIRRLRLKSASELPGANGWNSPKPAAASLFGGTPLPMRYFATEMAREAESSQFDLKVAVLIGRMSVWPSTSEHPVKLLRDAAFQVLKRGCELVELRIACRIQLRGAALEKDLGLKHEAVANHLDVVPLAQRFFQLAEEVGPVLRKLLHALGECHVEPLPEVGDLRLRCLIALVGVAERVLQRGELLAQRDDLLVQQFDLSQRLRRDAALLVKLFGDGGNPHLGAAAIRAQEARQALLLGFRRGKRRAKRGGFVQRGVLFRGFQGKGKSQLRDLFL